MIKVIAKCRQCGKTETVYCDDDRQIGFVEYLCKECFEKAYYSESYWLWTE
jgi:predicted RNA-binding Zn-ribbon protein involved in translation (DUF1610 family)